MIFTWAGGRGPEKNEVSLQILTSSIPRPQKPTSFQGLCLGLFSCGKIFFINLRDKELVQLTVQVSHHGLEVTEVGAWGHPASSVKKQGNKCMLLLSSLSMLDTAQDWTRKRYHPWWMGFPTSVNVIEIIWHSHAQGGPSLM